MEIGTVESVSVVVKEGEEVTEIVNHCFVCDEMINNNAVCFSGDVGKVVLKQWKC